MEGFSFSPAGCKFKNFDFPPFFPKEEKWKYSFFNLFWLPLWHYEVNNGDIQRGERQII